METENTLATLPKGKSFFDQLIEGGSYYVDKTLFVKDILDGDSAVTLCTRPRRFGKTLNQTMLKCFFEDTAPIGGKDTRALFRGLKIESAGERYMGHQGKYPVIFLSLKEVKRDTFERSYTQLKNFMAEEFSRHEYVMEKITKETDRLLFQKLADRNGSLDDYSTSLLFLCKCLAGCHGQKVIVLIDEYDVPLENSWVRGFYEEMVDFIRPFLSSGLKDNPYLQLAVMTGCLRVSKESIFTGLNNLSIISVLSNDYSEYFGFTQDEIDIILKYYGLEEKRGTLRDWYNGYLFGDTVVYNPWSCVNALSGWRTHINRPPEPYWANTSGNDIVRKMIDMVDGEAKEELETLMAGGTIAKTVHEDITYGDIYKDPDNVWNFLFFTGYLKKVSEHYMDVEKVLELCIPNLELKYIYITKIKEWFNERIQQKDFSKLHEAVLSGNAAVVQEELGEFLLSTISYMDGKEDFYHGVMLGVLAGIRDYDLKSNRETGLGRCDIVMTHRSGRGKAVVLELKWTADMREIQKKRDEALKQIIDGKYAKALENKCYNDIIKFGIAFCQKSCEVGRLD
ncbi:MAG: ATP-binding protein [Chitinispirillia bacterium]|nr:ATP-binding protein [Chitinispirillia bacterium]MCL2184031.1 ATP-binding protein [Chitinispirillia bacterium]